MKTKIITLCCLLQIIVSGQAQIISNVRDSVNIVFSQLNEADENSNILETQKIILQ